MHNKEMINKFIGDGIDHINVNEFAAKTTLGKALSLNKEHYFTHPVMGPFLSVGNFWNFIRTGGSIDEIRFDKEKHNRNLNKLPKLTIPNFHLIIADGYYYRIKSDEKIMKLFTENQLPIVSYDEHIVDDSDLKVKIVQRKHNFIIRALEETKKYFVKDLIPDEINYPELLPKLFSKK